MIESDNEVAVTEDKGELLKVDEDFEQTHTVDELVNEELQ